jgi:hypothetical protein
VAAKGRAWTSGLNNFKSLFVRHQGLPLRLANVHHGLDGGAILSIGNRPVDVAEFIELHEAVKGKLSCPVQLDQFRYKMLWHGVTLNDAEGFPSLWQ